MRPRTWIIVGVIAAIGLGGWYVMRSRSATPSAAAVRTITLKPSTLVRTLTETGSVESAREEPLAPPVAGRVTSVLATVGAQVHADTVLFTVDDTTLRGKVQQAEATVAKAQANLDDLEEGSSDADIATQERAVESARRSRLQAKASLQTNERVWALDLSAAKRNVDDARDREAKAVTDAKTADELGALEEEAIERDLDAAKRKLASAKTLRDAHEQAARDDLDTAERKRDRAERDLADATAELAALPPTATASERRQLEDAVAKAEDALEDAEANIDAVERNNDLDASQQDDSVASAEDAVGQVKRQLSTKQLQRTQERAANTNTITQAQRDRASAEDQLASKADSVALERANAEAAVADADAKLADAKTKLATLTDPPDATALAAAKADVASAESALRDAKDVLADAAVKAPFAGTLTQLALYEGQAVAANATVGTLSDLATLRILVNIPESELALVAAGQKATITFDSIPNLVLQGIVEAPERAPTVSSGVVFYKTRITLDATQEGMELLAPGLTANVMIEALNVPNVLVLPTRALGGTAAKRTVKVLGANGTTEERAVTVGRRGDDGIEVLTGLRGGDVVVVSNGTSTATQSGIGQGGGPGAFRVP